MRDICCDLPTARGDIANVTMADVEAAGLDRQDWSLFMMGLRDHQRDTLDEMASSRRASSKGTARRRSVPSS